MILLVSNVMLLWTRWHDKTNRAGRPHVGEANGWTRQMARRVKTKKKVFKSKRARHARIKYRKKKVFTTKKNIGIETKNKEVAKCGNSKEKRTRRKMRNLLKKMQMVGVKRTIELQNENKELRGTIKNMVSKNKHKEAYISELQQTVLRLTCQARPPDIRGWDIQPNWRPQY